MKHVLVVGVTGGLGRALAERYLELRWRVAGIGRDPDKLERVTADLRDDHPEGRISPIRCDVRDPDRLPAAFEEAVRELGQLDLLVYCAGVMDAPTDAGGRGLAAREMFEVNTAAAAHFLELGADYLAEAGKGQLAAIGSVAGDRGRKGNPAYCASKAALHTYLEGLRHRLHGSGVTVSTVKPGWISTRMLDEDRRWAVPPAEAAARIAAALDKGREVFYVPWWWRPVGLALRWTPRALFERFGPA